MAIFWAFAVVVALHIILLLNVMLKLAPHEKKSPSLMDVTLITMPSPVKPKQSDLIAAENQIGSKATPDVAPEPPRNTPVQTVKRLLPKQAKKDIAPPKIITLPETESSQLIEKKPKPVKHPKIEKIEQPVTEKVETEEKPHLSPELLQQQISQLGSDIRQQRLSNNDQRVKFIDSVSASKYVATQYLQDWESKVERTGNMNYPEVAMQKNFSGTLTMDVGIKADGSIYSIRINQSSGNPALDEAAKKIVRMSAPFAPLPTDLLKELDVLIITRVWRFSDQSGMTTQ